MTAARFDLATHVHASGSELGRVVTQRKSLWRKLGWQPGFDVTAAGACAVRVSDQVTIWGKDATARRTQASTTKVMTVHLALQVLGPLFDLDQTIAFLPQHEGSGSGDNLVEGDNISWRHAFLNAMLTSSNETCDMIGHYIGRNLLDDPAATFSQGLTRFYAEMNAEAARLGLVDTNYLSTSGLTSDPQHYTSAADLARMCIAAIQDARFQAAWSPASAALTVTGPNARTINVSHTVPMISDPDVQGAKSGTTLAAGAWAVMLAQTEDSVPVMVVVAASTADDRYVDARRIIDMTMA
ncbi:MAG: D-alanyl-D-alanine carboxypeptidase family protein [Paracoccus sp. (in: a-proteobacteria)]|uniref:D-alanyl-D-alanine carboxypeptidase family protein n=1 Tax=Paracoccus sp. TaxID=267 RepID=UPI00391BA2FA